MKARFSYKPNEHGFYCFDLCREYPDCNCDGHYIWEKNKKKCKGCEKIACGEKCDICGKTETCDECSH